MRVHLLLLGVVGLLVLTGARRRPGRLLVRSSTIGAIIEVDGEFMGEVPMTLPVVLPTGTRQVRVSLPGHADFVEDVRIRAGRDTVLDVELLALRAVVSVDADTPEARVLVGGKLVGLTPYRGELSPGRVTLVVHAAGRAPHRENIELEAGQHFQRRVVLAPMAAPPPAVGAATPWYESWWVWATAGAVVAGAVTTAVVLSADGDEGPAPPRHSLTFEPVR